MATLIKSLATVSAGSMFILMLAMPASAIDIGDRNKGLGVSVDVGKAGGGGLGVGVGATVGSRSSGVNAQSNTTVGGSKAVSSKTTASVGGATGINAAAKATVGGGSLANANVKASVGGVNAKVSATVGGASAANVDVSVGVPGGTGTGTPGAPNNPTGPAVALPDQLASMSAGKLAQLRKRCIEVMANPAAYDASLAELCRMIQMARR